MPNRSEARVGRKHSTPGPSLRMRQIIEMVSHGKVYKEIAAELGTTEGTAKITMRRAYERLKLPAGSGRMALAVRWWVEQEKTQC